MIGAAAAYMSGLFFASFFMDAKGVLMYAAAAVLVLLYGRRRQFVLKDYAVLGAAFAAAVTISLVYTAAVYRPAARYSGCTDSFTGRVTERTNYDGDRVSYVLRGRIGGDQRVRISLFSDDIGADIGDEISIGECTFSLPENDYLFDAENVYRSRHIELNAKKVSDVEVTCRDGLILRRALRDYRESMTARFRTEIGSDCGAFLAGMVFGEKRFLDGNIRSALYRTGIGHVLAVSGFHVSIVAALAMLILNRLRVNKYIAFGAVTVLIAALVALADYPVSALRAAIMLEIMYSARLFGRQSDSLNSLAVAVLLISVFDPYCVYNAGFLLSVAGTGGIAVFAPYMTKDMKRDTVPQKLAVSFVTSVCATLSVFPLCMYYFDETSLISPFANILLLPLCSAAMVLGLAYLLSFGLLPVLPAAKAVIRLILFISDVTASIPIFHTSDNTGFLRGLLLISAAAVIGVHLFRKDRHTLAVMVVCVTVLFTAASAITGIIRRNSFRVAVLGSGSNAAVVVTHGGHTDIADLSGYYRSAEYVRKYLIVNGISSADTVLLTKNVQAGYSAYEKELEIFPDYRKIVTGNTKVYGGDASIGGDSVTVENSGCTLRYSDGELIVSYRGKVMSFVPGREQNGSSGVTVSLGANEADTLSDPTNVSADDTEYDKLLTGNDFELVISDSGEYRIRRL